MNEGSRWDNTVPTVYSPNQAADTQDLSYGVQQFQPGQNPSSTEMLALAPCLEGVLAAYRGPGTGTLAAILSPAATAGTRGA